MASQSNKPTFKRGQRGGYDAASRRWRLADGTIVSKRAFAHREAPSPNMGDERFGFYQPVEQAPETTRWTLLENLVAAGERGEALASDPRLQQAGDRFNFIAGFVEPDRMPPGVKAEPIPSAMRAAYNLVDYYYDRCGDVAQSVEAPIDIALNPLEIQGEWADELREFYDRERLNLEHILFQIMYSTAKYGVAYPFEVWNQADPRKIVLLPPRHVWVGYHATQSYLFQIANKQLETPAPGDAAYALRPFDGQDHWSQALMDTAIKPISYGPVADHWRTQNPGGQQSWGLPVPLQYLDPVRAKSLDYERYAMPPLSRAFGSMGSRQVFHEMRRATMEGHKNQLWFFVLGEKDRPPSVEEMLAFKATINGMTGHRTGNLVWRFGADGKVLTVNSIDGLLSNEASALFDLAVWRDMGINMRLAAGNAPGITGSGGGEGLEIDLSLWLRRMEFMRKQVLDWEYGFRLRLAKRVGGASAVKAAKKTQVRFMQSLLELGEIVKKEVQPMYMTGLYSPQTALARLGRSYDVELENKKSHKPNEELFFPSPTYNQTTVGAGGKSNASAPQGRPSAATSRAKLKAAWEEDSDRGLYIRDVLLAFADYIQSGDAGKFSDDLITLNFTWLGQVTERSYRQTGGAGQLPNELKELAAAIVNAYVPGFREALLSAPQRDDPRLIARALLYPQEGYKMAFLNGQNAAMRERGASHWRRVMKASGCPDCAADALLLHAIDEPFRVLHPNENCAGQEQYIQYLIGGVESVEIPVPGSAGDFAELVAEILGASGDRSRRRRRP